MTNPNQNIIDYMTETGNVINNVPKNNLLMANEDEDEDDDDDDDIIFNNNGQIIFSHENECFLVPNANTTKTTKMIPNNNNHIVDDDDDNNHSSLVNHQSSHLYQINDDDDDGGAGNHHLNYSTYQHGKKLFKQFISPSAINLSTITLPFQSPLSGGDMFAGVCVSVWCACGLWKFCFFRNFMIIFLIDFVCFLFFPLYRY